MNNFSVSKNRSDPTGFSLIEVVLAIGIFLITVLALVGLLGPTLQSVDEVEKTDEVASVVNTINAFLQSSPEISGATGNSKFDLIYNAVAGGDHATIFIFREFIEDTVNVRLAVGFQEGESLAEGSLGTGSEIADARFGDAAGSIFRVILTPSSVIPTQYRQADRDQSTGTYSLNAELTDYLEGFFAMEVRIFAEDPGPTFTASKSLVEFNGVEPLFTYNTAVVR